MKDIVDTVVRYLPLICGFFCSGITGWFIGKNAHSYNKDPSIKDMTKGGVLKSRNPPSDKSIILTDRKTGKQELY